MGGCVEVSPRSAPLLIGGSSRGNKALGALAAEGSDADVRGHVCACVRVRVCMCVAV